MDAADEADEAPAERFPIRENILRDILASGTAQGPKSFVPAAVSVSSVLIRAFIEEAWSRAAAEAEECGDDEVKEEHLEKILPQLLLDMGP